MICQNNSAPINMSMLDGTLKLESANFILFGINTFCMSSEAKFVLSFAIYIVAKIIKARFDAYADKSICLYSFFHDSCYGNLK